MIVSKNRTSVGSSTWAITQGELRSLLTGTGFANVRVANQPLPTRFVKLAEQ